MAANVSVPNTFVALTPAASAEVNANFAAIVNWINSYATHLDGSKPFSAIPSGPASDPTQPNQFARKAYVDKVIPTGSVVMWTTNTPPSGWLLCDGTAVSRSTYADLWNLIGTTYGAGNGSTTFNLPNFKGRNPVGRDSGDADFNVLGETGGSKTRALAKANLPTHQHSIDHNHAEFDSGSAGSHKHDTRGDFASYLVPSDGSPAAAGRLTTTGTGLEVAVDVAQTDGAHTHPVNPPDFTGTSGGGSADGLNGDAFSIMNPYLTLNFIIKT